MTGVVKVDVMARRPSNEPAVVVVQLVLVVDVVLQGRRGGRVRGAGGEVEEDVC